MNSVMMMSRKFKDKLSIGQNIVFTDFISHDNKSSLNVVYGIVDSNNKDKTTSIIVLGIVQESEKEFAFAFAKNSILAHLV